MFMALALIFIIGVCGIGIDELAKTLASFMHYLKKIKKTSQHK